MKVWQTCWETMCASHVRQCGYVVSGSANADARMVVVPDRQQCYGYIYLPAQLRLSSPVSVQGARVLPAGRCGPVGSLHRKGSKRAPQRDGSAGVPAESAACDAARRTAGTAAIPAYSGGQFRHAGDSTS